MSVFQIFSNKVYSFYKRKVEVVKSITKEIFGITWTSIINPFWYFGMENSHLETGKFRSCRLKESFMEKTSEGLRQHLGKVTVGNRSGIGQLTLCDVDFGLCSSVYVGWPCFYPLHGFCGGSAGKESTFYAEDLSLIPGLRRSPGEGNSYPPWYSGLENSMDHIVHGIAKSQTLYTFRLSSV